VITPKILAAGLLGLAACRGATSPAPSVTFPIPSPAFAADSARVDTLAPGVVYRFFHASRGPWAIHVLDADRGSCWTTIALKAGSGAIGRASTSSLVADAARHTEVIGGVNADFFSFTPPGVPTGAHVHGGRLVTGPVERPAFLIDDIGAPHLATLATRGTAITGDDTIAIGRWNRRDARIVAWFDAAWGARTDTATGAIEVVLDASPAGLVAAIDMSTTGGIDWGATRLTWEGHQFLTAARSDTLWEKAKKLTLEKTGGLAFEFLKTALMKVGTDALTGG